MSQLDPDPSAVADLVVRVTRLPWPSGTTDHDRYFAELGLVGAGPAEAPRNDRDTQWRRLTTPLSGVVDASISLFRGELLGIHITCYNQRQDNGPQAQEGFAAVKQLLTDAFGPPTEEWGSLREPACLWQLSAVSVDTYCFQRDPSGTMVGTSPLLDQPRMTLPPARPTLHPSHRPITVTGGPQADRLRERASAARCVSHTLSRSTGLLPKLSARRPEISMEPM
jgi:hypothetical protein